MTEQRDAPVAIVTGAASGIGAAVARRLAADGWRVVVTGRRTLPLQAIAEDIRGLAISGDVSVQADAQRLVDRAMVAYGRLDGLVLNAGIARPGSVLDISLEDWQATIDVNLTGAFLVSRAALPHLLERKGAIVAVGSIAAFVAGPKLAAYGASKAGLVRLILSIAVDYARAGVRANVVNPGWIRTEMADEEMAALGQSRGLDVDEAYAFATQHVPARRPGRAEEAAAAVAWLLSADAGYVTGSVLTVDGGTSIVDVGMLGSELSS